MKQSRYLLLPLLLALPLALEAQTWFNGQLWHPKPLPKYEKPKFKSLLTVNRPVRFDLSTDHVITPGDAHFSTVTVSNMSLPERGTTTVTITGSQPAIPANTPPNPPVYPDMMAFPPGGETFAEAEIGFEIGEAAPGEVGLRVFPNPAHGSAQVEFSLPEAQPVRLELWQAEGRQVLVLAEGRFEAGTHSVAWQAGDLPPGAYWCRLLTKNGVRAVRVVLF